MKKKSDKKNVLVGVTGGIAIYKACDLVNMLKKDNFAVKVIMTKNAKEFITPLPFATLSNEKVHDDMFASREYYDVEHIELAKWCSIMLIAPATANVIGKIANGIADDLLSTVVLSLPASIPILIAPAMNTNMWLNPTVKKNTSYLRSQKNKYYIIEPREGRLACRDYGEGAMARVDVILKELKKHI